jgi:hypothetical protein
MDRIIISCTAPDNLPNPKRCKMRKTANDTENATAHAMKISDMELFI